MCYKNMKAMGCSPDGDTDFFNIVTEVFEGDTLALYLFILCLDYLFRTSINLIRENGFALKKADKRSKNCNRCRLCRLFSTSHKYNSTSRIPTA